MSRASPRANGVSARQPPPTRARLLDVVNLRTLAGIDDRATVLDNLTPQFEALAELQQQGLIRQLGLSTVSLDQLAEAQQIARVVCVQNIYNIANRADEAVLAATGEQGIAYVPYFPLGGFSPLQSDVLESVAKRLSATPTTVAQSWLLQHSPNMMLIPGTSSVDHLRENIAGAALPRRPTPWPSWTRSEQWTAHAKVSRRPACSPLPWRWQRLAGTMTSTAVCGRSVLPCSTHANHHDPVTPPHLSDGKPGSCAPAGA